MRFELDNKTMTWLNRKYREAKYPYGKSIKGRKKWIKQYIIQTLEELVYGKQEKTKKKVMR